MSTINNLSSQAGLQRVNLEPIPVHQPEISTEQLQQRIELHVNDTLETVSSSAAKGSASGLPLPSQEDRTALHSIYSNVTPDGQMALAKASHSLAGAIYSQVASGADLTSASAGVQATMSHATEQYILNSGEKNLETVTTNVMRLAVDGVNQDLLGLAGQLQNTLNTTKGLREDIAEFNDIITDWPEGGGAQEVTYTKYDPATGTNVEVTETMTKAQAETRVKDLDMQLSSAGEDRQMFQLDLQDAMQKEAQAMQMLSNMLKMFHDTAKALIQNMRA